MIVSFSLTKVTRLLARVIMTCRVWAPLDRMPENHPYMYFYTLSNVRMYHAESCFVCIIMQTVTQLCLVSPLGSYIYYMYNNSV